MLNELKFYFVLTWISIYTVDFRSGGRFPAGERKVRKDTVQSFPAASLAALSPGSRLSRFPAGVAPLLSNQLQIPIYVESEVYLETITQSY